jgi:hypothetical protein
MKRTKNRRAAPCAMNQQATRRPIDKRIVPIVLHSRKGYSVCKSETGTNPKDVQPVSSAPPHRNEETSGQNERSGFGRNDVEPAHDEQGADQAGAEIACWESDGGWVKRRCNGVSPSLQLDTASRASITKSE